MSCPPARRGRTRPPAVSCVRPGSAPTIPAPPAAGGRGYRIERSYFTPEGQPIDPAKIYKVAGWAPVAEEAKTAGNKPVWELVETWLKAHPEVVEPWLVGVTTRDGGDGLAAVRAALGA